MHKRLINLFLVLLCFPALAVDTQSKFRNTDRSLFETISDYQTIERGRFYFSNTGSLTSNPLVSSKGDVLINSLTDFEFSAITGVTKNWEIGISIPYSKTSVSETSGLNNFSGTGDVYIENKFRILDSFSLVPVVIYQSGDGLVGTGSNSGGYGLKAVGAFNERTKFPLYYSLGYYSLPDTKFQEIDQSQRIQASAGSMLNLTKEILLGAEFFIDHAKNRSSKEILAHSTMHLGSLSVRAGVGSGFLNQDDLNNLRVFASLLFDLDFRSNKQKFALAPLKKVEAPIRAYNPPKAETAPSVDSNPSPVKEEVKPITEPKIEEPVKEDEVDKKLKEIEAIQQKINAFNYKSIKINRSFASADVSKKVDTGLLVDNSLVDNSSVEEDDAMVIPGYTVRELKKIKKESIKQEEISLDKVVFDKNERLKVAQRNLSFWVSEFESKTEQSKIRAELSWGLRVVDRRRNTLEELYAKNKDKMDKLTEGRYFQLIQDSEEKAKKYLSGHNVQVNTMEKIATSQSSPTTKAVIIDVAEKPSEKPKNSLEENQKKQWEISKKKTYRELMAEKKGIKLAKETQIIKAPNTQSEFAKNEKELPPSVPEDVVVLDNIKEVQKETKIDSNKLIQELTLASIPEPDQVKEEVKIVEKKEEIKSTVAKEETPKMEVPAPKKTEIKEPVVTKPKEEIKPIVAEKPVEKAKDVIVPVKEAPVAKAAEPIAVVVTPTVVKDEPVLVKPELEIAKEEPAVVKSAPVVITDEVKNEPVVTIAPTEVVVVTGDTVNLDIVDVIDEKKDEKKLEDSATQAVESSGEIVVPNIESIVSSGVEIKQNNNLNENVDETLNKIKVLVEEKKKEDSAYSSLVDFYKKQVEDMKIKLEEKEAAKQPKKEIELVIEEKAVPEFKQDGTIEIKHFKVNSIRERFQEDQPTAQEFRDEDSGVGNRNNDSGVMGLEEGGELEYSSGPSY